MFTLCNTLEFLSCRQSDEEHQLVFVSIHRRGERRSRSCSHREMITLDLVRQCIDMSWPNASVHVIANSLITCITVQHVCRHI